MAVGYIVLVICTVSHVKVNIEGGIVVIHHPYYRLHFFGVKFRVVAVEVEIPGVRAPPHILWTALVGAIEGRNAFMAVDIENGNEQKVNIVE